MSFPRYPEYKDSGVEWLGEVPSNWSTHRLKYVSSVSPSNVDKKTYDDQSPVQLCNYTDVYYRDLIGEEIAFMPATATDDQIAKFSLQAGDVLITKDSETPDDIAVSASVPADLPNVVCGYHLALIRPSRGCDGRFIKFLFDSRYVRSRFAVLANGLTRYGLSQYALDNIEIPIPTHEEQCFIATFLDRETGKIDALIAEQEKLIALLKEKRQALISHAVTKGLDATVPMIDSGIEWLDQVPPHWGIVRNKTVFVEIDDRNTADDGELLTVSHLTGITRRSEKNVNMIMAETLGGYKKCRAGDLVINTMWAWMGALGTSPLDGLVSPSYNVYRIRDQQRLDPGYYDFLCRIPPHVIEIKANSTGVWESRLRLYPQTFLAMVVCLPPLAEQSSIRSFLDHQTGKYDVLVDEALRSIDLLKERRSALISAAVTGKIDVRGLTSATELT